MSADAILTQGCTFTRVVSITNDDGTPYDLSDADSVEGALSAPDGYETLENELTVLSAVGGTCQFDLSPIVTAGLPAPCWAELEIRVVEGSNKQPVGKYVIRVEPGSFS